MRDHCYWPFVSDLINVLSHKPVAYKFMVDERLLQLWFEITSCLQGMNSSTRLVSICGKIITRRMQSSRMCTVRCSGRTVGGGCLPQCMLGYTFPVDRILDTRL